MSDDCAETREQRDPACARIDAEIDRIQRKLCGLRHAPPPPPPMPPSPPPQREAEPCSIAEDRILDAIRQRRRGNGITAHELAAIGEVNERTARAIVTHLTVEHDEPICGTPAESFFWPDRIEEVDHTLASLQSRKLALEQRIEGLRRGAARVFGSMNLFEEL